MAQDLELSSLSVEDALQKMQVHWEIACEGWNDARRRRIETEFIQSNGKSPDTLFEGTPPFIAAIRELKDEITQIECSVE